MGFVRWLLGYEDCPRCDEPLRPTAAVVNDVERIWVCDLCRGRLPIVDRALVAKRKRQTTSSPS
jgi:hypothetical protein